MRFFLRRLVQSVLLLAATSVFSFVLLDLAPGDFLDEIRLNPQISSQTVAALRSEYGLNRSLPWRYLQWLNSIRKGDFGISFAYDVPVTVLLKSRVRNTLVLTGLAAALAWLIAIPLGVWSASRRGGWADRVCMGTMSGLLGIPDILLALGLLLLAARTGWLPAGGMVSLGFDELPVWDKAKDVAAHLLLPLAALVLGSLPVLVRHVRAAVAEVLWSLVVLSARARGIPRRSVLFRYALRAAANPLASLVGLSLAMLLSGSLLVEIIMSWPGVGPLLLEAILARDLYVVIGAVMFSTLFILAGNLTADAVLYALDPRIRSA